MQIFYCDTIIDGKARFGRDESGHCLRVLRMRRGDTISFTDGRGNFYEGLITDDNPAEMTADHHIGEKSGGRPLPASCCNLTGEE
jgi:16S rRNA (uracil1498-N3)-methyltransferase